MELQIHLDVLFCKVFPTTLTAATQTWFKNLEYRSIKSFVNVENLFIRRFTECSSRKKNELFRNHQAEKEWDVKGLYGLKALNRHKFERGD